jgi:tetratricopeptide (TPR) repeat protein
MAVIPNLSVVEKLVETIWRLLKKEKPSNKDRDILKTKLTELINLSSETGLALEKYSRLLKHSTEASVHSTELQSMLKVLPKVSAEQQFTKLLDVRIQTNLRKEGIDKIYKYREDYEKADEHYVKAEKHLTNAQQLYFSGNTSCFQEMEYLNQELDKLVRLSKKRSEALFEVLREAYKIL